MFYPDLETVIKLSKNYAIIPVSLEVRADLETPISIFKKIGQCSSCFLLESAEGGEKWGRYSFIGKNPFLVLKGSGRRTLIEHRDGFAEYVERNAISVLKELMNSYRGAPIKELPMFNGGAVGFLGYDTARYYENLPNMPEDDIGIPEAHFMFADEIIAFDHFRHKIHIIVNLHVAGQMERNYNKVTGRIKEISKELDVVRSTLSVDDSGMSSTWRNNAGQGTRKPEVFEWAGLKVASNISRVKFCENVVKAKEYINNGDVLQVVLSQRFHAQTSCSPVDAYRALRTINPGPYMYYLKFNDYTLVGSSPEMLIKVIDGKAETHPVAGTRRRGATPGEDSELEKELLADGKERNEHLMLVDLAINEMEKISQSDTVMVDSLMRIERFSHVMHIVSSVSGRLMDGVTPLDALSSLLPAGTLSGAPKLRAMEIIDELEKVKRCQYGGAVCYLSFDGNLDSCIAIRTILFKRTDAYVQAGAGIVADSAPEQEYMESVNKAGALIMAIQEGENIQKRGVEMR